MTNTSNWNTYSNIPLAMREQKKWLAWTKELQDGKERKVPYQIRRGARADVSNPSTWTDFTTVRMCSQYYSGIGYVLDGSGIICIDLDDCLYLSTGRANETAARIVKAMASYTEISQSGRGLHIFGRANAELVERIGNGKRRNGLEVYANKRYIATTGNVYGGHDELTDISTPLDLLLKKHFAAQEQDAPNHCNSSKSQSTRAALLTAVPPLTESDKTLIDKARHNELTGAAFTRLFDHGDLSAYGNNHSRADWHLACILRFWTNGDREAMTRIFCASALFRKEKGLTKRRDYIPRTINNAIARGNGNGYLSSIVQKAR